MRLPRLAGEEPGDRQELRSLGSRKHWCLGPPENSQVDLLQVAFVENEIQNHYRSPLRAFPSRELRLSRSLWRNQVFWPELGPRHLTILAALM